ncbi:TonB-dependent receptor [Hyphomicrobium sp. D-2]|uniref:TonB-dependent receptor plug domain-containing protein n=1 Tax=Hyphomicrobium sp. D-2 TaxID=3041621 RepID=UPI0024544F02|nr:TonB-dependent receptor [Hyphomicrobium sp. D-2]MDH4981133.1 TonB-dependent receptor [Hyphomicrobium sp. D-2]
MRKVAYAALCSAAMGVLLSDAIAQEAPVTAAGDISASEATPLPPLDVTAPSQPIVKRKPKKTQSSGSGSAVATSDGMDEGIGLEDTAAPPSVFTLGQNSMIGGSTVGSEAIWTFNKLTLDQAVAMAPGVSMSNLGGSRNERDIFVRGFDRWRVPLTMDGVRIYLPADNRLDMNRFLTPDLAEIQIEKGYVSVLNGPGGMGGAINLVSRKPTKAFEAEARVGVVFDGDLEGRNAVNSYGMMGTRKSEGYAQISGTIVSQDHWNLSNDFTPTPFENGGLRDNSETEDWRINAKVGYTPNATDEYAISYTSQAGSKSAPLHIEGGNRFWKWPTWDITSLAGFSHTKIGEASYVKSNVYYNQLNNNLRSFDDATYTTQSLGRGFNSWYDDFAYGGMVEVGTQLIPMNTLKGSVHYRLDNHSEYDHNRPDHSSGYIEPKQETEERNWYYALENTFHATSWLDIVGGVSKDHARLLKAEKFNSTTRLVESYPTGEGEAWNWQSAVIARYSDTGKVHASVSNRTRFPNIFERFSTRFGTAEPNPDLDAEEARNYELGWSDTFNRRLRLSGAVFYSEIDNAIQSVLVRSYLDTNGSTVQVTQNQNVGDGTHKGIELAVDYDLMPGLRVGGNYTYLRREIRDPLRPGLKSESTPEHEGFVYLAWDAMSNLTITPSLELASDRWSLASQGADANQFIQIGSYALVNLNVEYRVNEIFSASVGGRNLTDQNYMLVEGFPEPGRQFFANVRARY